MDPLATSNYAVPKTETHIVSMYDAQLDALAEMWVEKFFENVKSKTTCG